MNKDAFMEQNEQNRPRKLGPDSFSLNLNSWLASILLVFLIFSYYYTWFYPSLDGKYQTGFWTAKTATLVSDTSSGTKNYDLLLSIRYPKYLTSYDYSDLEIILENSGEKKLEGYITIVGYVFSGASSQSAQGLTVDHRPQGSVLLAHLEDGEKIGLPVYNFSQQYNLSAHTSEVYQIKAKVQSIDNFVDELVTYKFTNTVTSPPINDSAEIVQESGKTSCESYGQMVEFKDIDADYMKFCGEVNSVEAFRQKAIEKMLLPPWSNIVWPLVVILLVFYVEFTIEDIRKKQEESLGIKTLLEILIPSFFLCLLVGFVLQKLILPGDFSRFNKQGLIIGMLIFILLLILMPPITRLLIRSTSFVIGWVFQKLREIFYWKEIGKLKVLPETLFKHWKSDYEKFKETNDDFQKQLGVPAWLYYIKEAFLGSPLENSSVLEDLVERFKKAEIVLQDESIHHLNRIKNKLMLDTLDISSYEEGNNKFWENYQTAYKWASRSEKFLSDGSWFFEKEVNREQVIEKITSNLKKKIDEHIRFERLEDSEKASFIEGTVIYWLDKYLANKTLQGDNDAYNAIKRLKCNYAPPSCE